MCGVQMSLCTGGACGPDFLKSVRSFFSHICIPLGGVRNPDWGLSPVGKGQGGKGDKKKKKKPRKQEPGKHSCSFFCKAHDGRSPFPARYLCLCRSVLFPQGTQESHFSLKEWEKKRSRSFSDLPQQGTTKWVAHNNDLVPHWKTGVRVSAGLAPSGSPVGRSVPCLLLASSGSWQSWEYLGV